MKVIDIEKWTRKAAFENFSSYTSPIFSVGTRFDVTNLVGYCKKNNRSFFASFLFIVTKCANMVEEMKYRIIDDKVVAFDAAHPSYIVLRDDGSIVTCLTEFEDDFNRFYDNTRADIKKKRESTPTKDFNSSGGADCLYVSCLPWVDITSVTNPYNFNDFQQSSIPRIAWGKYVKNNVGGYEMGFNISAHHGLVDGLHVARVIELMSNALENAEAFLGG